MGEKERGKREIKKERKSEKKKREETRKTKEKKRETETRRDETLTLDVRDAVTPQHCKTPNTSTRTTVTLIALQRQ